MNNTHGQTKRVLSGLTAFLMVISGIASPLSYAGGVSTKETLSQTLKPALQTKPAVVVQAQPAKTSQHLSGPTIYSHPLPVFNNETKALADALGVSGTTVKIFSMKIGKIEPYQNKVYTGYAFLVGIEGMSGNERTMSYSKQKLFQLADKTTWTSRSPKSVKDVYNILPNTPSSMSEEMQATLAMSLRAASETLQTAFSKVKIVKIIKGKEEKYEVRFLLPGDSAKKPRMAEIKRIKAGKKWLYMDPAAKPVILTAIQKELVTNALMDFKEAGLNLSNRISLKYKAKTAGEIRMSHKLCSATGACQSVRYAVEVLLGGSTTPVSIDLSQIQDGQKFSIGIGSEVTVLLRSTDFDLAETQTFKEDDLVQEKSGNERQGIQVTNFDWDKETAMRTYSAGPTTGVISEFYTDLRIVGDPMDITEATITSYEKDGDTNFVVGHPSRIIYKDGRQEDFLGELKIASKNGQYVDASVPDTGTAGVEQSVKSVKRQPTLEKVEALQAMLTSIQGMLTSAEIPADLMTVVAQMKTELEAHLAWISEWMATEGFRIRKAEMLSAAQEAIQKTRDDIKQLERNRPYAVTKQQNDREGFQRETGSRHGSLKSIIDELELNFSEFEAVKDYLTTVFGYINESLVSETDAYKEWIGTNEVGEIDANIETLNEYLTQLADYSTMISEATSMEQLSPLPSKPPVNFNPTAAPTDPRVSLDNFSEQGTAMMRMERLRAQMLKLTDDATRDAIDRLKQLENNLPLVSNQVRQVDIASANKIVESLDSLLGQLSEFGNLEGIGRFIDRVSTYGTNSFASELEEFIQWDIWRTTRYTRLLIGSAREYLEILAMHRQNLMSAASEGQLVEPPQENPVTETWIPPVDPLGKLEGFAKEGGSFFVDGSEFDGNGLTSAVYDRETSQSVRTKDKRGNDVREHFTAVEQREVGRDENGNPIVEVPEGYEAIIFFDLHDQGGIGYLIGRRE